MNEAGNERVICAVAVPRVQAPAGDAVRNVLLRACSILEAAAEGRSVQIAAGTCLKEANAVLAASAAEIGRVKKTLALIDDLDRHGSIERTVAQELRRSLK